MVYYTRLPVEGATGILSFKLYSLQGMRPTGLAG